MLHKEDSNGVEWTLRRCKACYAPFKHPSLAKDVACPQCQAVHHRSKLGPSIREIRGE